MNAFRLDIRFDTGYCGDATLADVFSAHPAVLSGLH